VLTFPRDANTASTHTALLIDTENAAKRDLRAETFITQQSRDQKRFHHVIYNTHTHTIQQAGGLSSSKLQLCESAGINLSPARGEQARLARTDPLDCVLPGVTAGGPPLSY